MIIAKKIRIIPTKEQEILFWKSAGVARWAYNYYLSEREKAYKNWIDNGKIGKFIFSELKLRRYINNELKPTTYKWLGDVSAQVMTQAVKDADKAYSKFFKGLSNKPKFKSKHRSKPSFYVRHDSVKRLNYGFKGEKLGVVRTTENLPKLKKGQKYSEPRITYDGQYWYLSIGYEKEINKQKLTNKSIGIDLGIKELAVCSNGKTYKNINKTKKVKRLEKKLKREQRKLSRKRNLKKIEPKNPKSKYKVDLKECKNLQKQNEIVQKLYNKLTNIRNNHIHQATAEIVKTKPSRVVMEDLNVKGIMKNKHLAKSIMVQKLYEFRIQMEYKCKLNGIEFVLADRFYPSSKTCSCCGHIKKDLKLKNRIYKCDKCGLEIDRDFNASVNLANYDLTI